MKRALISVSDKTGLIDFAKKLIQLNYEILSTGGTYKTLIENGVNAISVSNITEFPEMMDGRVKTLHPKIHGGLLYLRDNEEHCQQAEQNNIQAIDMLVINLYPFEATIQKKDSSWHDIIENIDIGGPAMLRSGAKNYKFVTVLIDPNDYEQVIKEISQNGDSLSDTRLHLAQKVFAHTSYYDSLIAKTFAEKIDNYDSIPLTLNMPVKQNLRYGENPHQPAKYYQYFDDYITQLHGKELSYNNLLDIDAALKTILKFSKPTVAIFKHTNPCGIASDDSISVAYTNAFSTDTVSPFGGIVVTNTLVDTEFVDTVNKVFSEIIIAPEFSEEALSKLQKKKDRRLIRYHQNKLFELKNHPQIQSCLNGYLVQKPDLENDDIKQWEFPTNIKPDSKELEELHFSWQVVKMLKSNAICFTKENRTIGLGIGQTSRIDSMNIAIERANRMNLSISGSFCASDGFFPFRDSIDKLAEIGVKFVIQPGGSKADSEVIEACNDYGIAMVLTGKRHFRH